MPTAKSASVTTIAVLTSYILPELLQAALRPPLGHRKFAHLCRRAAGVVTANTQRSRMLIPTSPGLLTPSSYLPVEPTGAMKMNAVISAIRLRDGPEHTQSKSFAAHHEKSFGLRSNGIRHEGSCSGNTQTQRFTGLVYSASTSYPSMRTASER